MEQRSIQISILGAALLFSITLVVLLPSILATVSYKPFTFYTLISPAQENSVYADIRLYQQDYYAIRGNSLIGYDFPRDEELSGYYHPVYINDVLRLDPDGTESWTLKDRPHNLRPSQQVNYSIVKDKIICRLYDSYNFEDYFIVEEHVYERISNPLTLWYITWLEWTSDK